MFTEKGRLSELAKRSPDVEFIYEKTNVIGSIWYSFNFNFLNKNIKNKIVSIYNSIVNTSITTYNICLYDIIEEKIFNFPFVELKIKGDALQSGFIESNSVKFKMLLEDLHHEKFIYSDHKIEKQELTINLIAFKYKNAMPCLQMTVV